MLAFAAVTGVLLFSTERLVYQPIVGRIGELDQEILAKENELRKNARELAAAATVRNAYAAYGAYAATGGTEEEEIARLLGEVERIARKSGLFLASVKPKPASEINLGKQYPLEIEVETEMAPLIKFIHGLHESKYLLRVKQLRVVPKATRTTRVKAHLLINRTVIR